MNHWIERGQHENTFIAVGYAGIGFDSEEGGPSEPSNWLWTEEHPNGACDANMPTDTGLTLSLGRRGTERLDVSRVPFRVSEGSHTLGEFSHVGRVGRCRTHRRGDVTKRREQRAGLSDCHDRFGPIGQLESLRQIAVESIEICMRYRDHAAEHPGIRLADKVHPRSDGQFESGDTSRDHRTHGHAVLGNNPSEHERAVEEHVDRHSRCHRRASVRASSGGLGRGGEVGAASCAPGDHLPSRDVRGEL